jgi:uncharacterized protein YndB with AHSA1/START domain
MTTREEANRRDAVEKVVRIAARPEVVYSFFIDPAKMMRWKGLSAALEPHPGGIYHVTVTPVAIAKGEYVELVPNSRVVFTWGWEGSPDVPPGSTTVEVDLTPDGDGTLLRLRHFGLAGDQALLHEQGWAHYLARLAIAAPGGDPGPDPHAAGEPMA